MNWGASYYDHLERLFRSPISRETFSQEPDEPTIQVLAYDRVFPRCRVFASLGLSHYARQVGRVAEVYLAVDDGWTEAGAILANALFYVIQNELPIGWGMAVGGVGAVTPAFAQQFAKTALYFTNPFGLPPGAADVYADGERGSLYLALFISEPEYQAFLREGAEGFERILQSRRVDPYALARPSAV